MRELEKFNDLKILKEIDALKAKIEKLRPLTNEQENRIMQKFRLDWNYHSNAIEGNQLDLGETKAFIMYGVTAKGKPLKDHLDIRGHNEAINFLEAIVQKKQDFLEADIRELHKVILVEPYEMKATTTEGTIVKKIVNLGAYKSSPNHVKTFTGEIHYYATPEETPIKMKELMEWYKKVENSSLHPLIIASMLHYQFVAIHPFDDGNGRMARLLMNLVLMRNHFPPAIIKIEDRDRYYLALSQADAQQYQPFIEFVGKELIHSLEIYYKGAMGESIDEPNDLDKEILLFKKELAGRKDKLEVKKSTEAIGNIYVKTIKELLNELEITFSKFKEMFLNSTYFLVTKKENKWVYTSLKDIHSVQERIELQGFEGNIGPLIVAFGLGEFKSAENPFSFEIKMFCYFDNYEYRIYLTMTESKELNNIVVDKYNLNLPNADIINYYHLNPSKEEIKSLSNSIGKKVLAYIRKEYQVKNHNLLSLSDDELNNIWIEFINKTIHDPSVLQLISRSTLEIHNGKKIVVKSADANIRNIVYELLSEFVNYLIKKLNVERGIAF